VRVYGLLKWRNEFESGGVVVLVTEKSHCDLQPVLFQMPWIYISHFVFSVISTCDLRINQALLADTASIPFLILSVFRAVRCFYSAYSHIVFTHIWRYEQPQETRWQNPENDDDILRCMFVCIQIVNIMMYLYAICTALLNHFYTTLPTVILHHNCTFMHNSPMCFYYFFCRILPWHWPKMAENFMILAYYRTVV